jgi:hypothetical protein
MKAGVGPAERADRDLLIDDDLAGVTDHDWDHRSRPLAEGISGGRQPSGRALHGGCHAMATADGLCEPLQSVLVDGGSVVVSGCLPRRHLFGELGDEVVVDGDVGPDELRRPTGVGRPK